MKTQTTIFDLTEKLTFGIKNTITNYKGFQVVSNVVHCGMGGNLWLSSVIDQRGIPLENFCDESYTLTEKESFAFIDDYIKIPHC